MSRKLVNSDFDVVSGPAPLRPLPGGSLPGGSPPGGVPPGGSPGAQPAGLTDRQSATPVPRPAGLHEKPAR